MDEKRYLKEKEYLEVVKDLIKKEIVSIEQEIKEIPKKYRHRYSDVSGGDEQLIEHLIEMSENRRKRLIQMVDNSYFGKFSFTDDLIGICEDFYIGKSAVSNKEGKIFTLDWRAPICSLYYDQDMGRVKYYIENIEHTGELTLKSQILISDGKIDNIIDTNLISKDELILPFLKASATDKMKDIVSSIQKEQNEIIRYPFNQNIIVQGVAGSGKTSVALHRIAYLLYSEQKYKANQFLVIGPNKCFNDYISQVLPDLDSSSIDIEQIIFSDLISQFLKEKIKIQKNNQSESISNYKFSLSFKNDIENFLKDYINDMEINISIFEIPIISSQKIKSFILSASGNLKQKLDIAMEKTIQLIKNNCEEIEDQIWKEFNKKTTNNPSEVFEQKTEIRKQLKTGCKNIVKKEFSKYNLKLLDLYKEFIRKFDIYCFKLSNSEISEFQRTTIKNIEEKKITDSDIPAILYLGLMTKKIDTDQFVHVVIDEAQDYGLFHFFVLKQLFKNSTFSIFGDLAQAIYGTQSIKDWNELNEMIFDDNAKILNLQQSYRTTKEITLEANKVLKNLCLNTANPVLRTGAPVMYLKNGDIYSQIKNLIDKQYKSIALICKDEKETVEVYSEISRQILNIRLVNDNDLSYQGGVCVVDVNSSKGLEFDAVIVADASIQKYQKNSLVDSKKLYVAMTRALHELIISYNDILTDALCVTENNNFEKIKELVRRN